MLALGARLAARGHEVTFETWTRWREDVEARGHAVRRRARVPGVPDARAAAEALRGGGPRDRARRAPRWRRAARTSSSHDILTLAPAMAGELEGVPVATLIPHVYPASAPGAAPYALGARLPRTRARAGHVAAHGSARSSAGLRAGTRRAQRDARRSSACNPSSRAARRAQHAAGPRRRRSRSSSIRASGPPQCTWWARCMWEPPYRRREPPPGDAPLVLVAPSTAQDPAHELLRAALQGLDGEPVRVIAATNRSRCPSGSRCRRTRGWSTGSRYARTMPRCALVITHAGHGTVARALACGRRCSRCPHVATWARTPPGSTGRAWACGCRWRFLSPARCGSRCAGPWRSRRSWRERPSCALGGGA